MVHCEGCGKEIRISMVEGQRYYCEVTQKGYDYNRVLSGLASVAFKARS